MCMGYGMVEIAAEALFGASPPGGLYNRRLSLRWFEPNTRHQRKPKYIRRNSIDTI